MSRAEKYFSTILDFLFIVVIGMLFLLLLLLRYVSKTTEKEPVADLNNEPVVNSINTIAEYPKNEAQAISSIEEKSANITEEVIAMPERLVESEAEQRQELEIEKAEAYCVKCREKREMQNASRVVTKNGRNALEGVCPVCNTKLFRFIAR